MNFFWLPLGKGSKPPVTESVRKGGGGYPPFPLTFFRSVFGNRPSVKGGGGVPPLSVNFFPLTFWVKNSVFWVKNTKKCRLRRKFLNFVSVKGGGGYPPCPLSFFFANFIEKSC